MEQNLKLLKVHLPYHESDHVLNLAYNVLVGGEHLEDIELRRQDESFLERARTHCDQPRREFQFWYS